MQKYKKTAWTAHEDAQLAEMAHLPYKQVATELHRALDDVVARYKDLGIKRTCTRGRVTDTWLTGKRWTEQEDNKLRAAFGDATPKQLCYLLPERSPSAIYARARVLGLTRGKGRGLKHEELVAIMQPARALRGWGW